MHHFKKVLNYKITKFTKILVTLVNCRYFCNPKHKATLFIRQEQFVSATWVVCPCLIPSKAEKQEKHYLFLHIYALRETYSHRSPISCPCHSRRWWRTTGGRPPGHRWYSPHTPSPGRGRGRDRAYHWLCRHSPQELHQPKITGAGWYV